MLIGSRPLDVAESEQQIRIKGEDCLSPQLVMRAFAAHTTRPFCFGKRAENHVRSGTAPSVFLRRSPE